MGETGMGEGEGRGAKEGTKDTQDQEARSTADAARHTGCPVALMVGAPSRDCATRFCEIISAKRTCSRARRRSSWIWGVSNLFRSNHVPMGSVWSGALNNSLCVCAVIAALRLPCICCVAALPLY